MAILSIPKTLFGDEYIMNAVRRAFDTLQPIIYLPQKVVCRVTGPMMPGDGYEINPIVVTTGKGVVLINNIDKIYFYPN